MKYSYRIMNRTVREHSRDLWSILLIIFIRKSSWHRNFFPLLSPTSIKSKQRMMFPEKIVIFKKSLFDSYNCLFLTYFRLEWNPIPRIVYCRHGWLNDNQYSIFEEICNKYIFNNTWLQLSRYLYALINSIREISL